MTPLGGLKGNSLLFEVRKFFPAQQAIFSQNPSGFRRQPGLNYAKYALFSPTKWEHATLGVFSMTIPAVASASVLQSAAVGGSVVGVVGSL